MLTIFESKEFPSCYFQTNAHLYRYPIDLHRKFFSWLKKHEEASYNAHILNEHNEFSNGERNTLISNPFTIGGDCGWANYAMDTAIKIYTNEEIESNNLKVSCLFCPHAWSVEGRLAEKLVEYGASTCYGGRLFRFMLLKDLYYYLTNRSEKEPKPPFSFLNQNNPKLNLSKFGIVDASIDYIINLLKDIFEIEISPLSPEKVHEEVEKVCQEIIDLPVKEGLKTIEEGNG